MVIATFASLATRALKRPQRVLSVLQELAPLSEVGPVSPSPFETARGSMSASAQLVQCSQLRMSLSQLSCGKGKIKVRSILLHGPLGGLASLLRRSFVEILRTLRSIGQNRDYAGLNL